MSSSCHVGMIRSRMTIKAQEPLKDPIHSMKVNPYHTPIRLEEFTPDFEAMTKKLEAFWEAQGVEWKFGIEHEFRWGDVEGDVVQESVDAQEGLAPDPRTPETRLDDANHRLQEYAIELKKMEKVLKELPPQECRQRLDDLREKHKISFGISDSVEYRGNVYISAGSAFLDFPDADAQTSSAQMIRDEAMMVTRIYRNRLHLRDAIRKHFDDEIVQLSKKHLPESIEVKHAKAKREAIETFELRELIMCWVHELSPIKDRLEYVFGKGTGGAGYYDNDGVGEMRVKPTSPSEAALLQRELVITLSQAAYDYGIGLWHSANEHIHISAHKDGQTLTDSRITQVAIQMPDKDGLPDSKKTRQLSHQAFREQMIHGMLALGYDTMPMWKNVNEFETDRFVTATGQSRSNTIRQLSNRVEWRMDLYSNLNPNIAEIVSLVLAGATYGLTNPENAKERASKIGAKSGYHARFRHLKQHPEFSDDQIELLQDLVSMSDFVLVDDGSQGTENKHYRLKTSRNENILINNYFGQIAGLMGLPEGGLSGAMVRHELEKITIRKEKSDGVADAAPRLMIDYAGANEPLKKALSFIRCDHVIPAVSFDDRAILKHQKWPLAQPLDGSDQPRASVLEQKTKLLDVMKQSPHVKAVFEQWGDGGLYNRLMDWAGDWFPAHTPDFKVSNVRYRERVSERHPPTPTQTVMQ